MSSRKEMEVFRGVCRQAGRPALGSQVSFQPKPEIHSGGQASQTAFAGGLGNNPSNSFGEVRFAILNERLTITQNSELVKEYWQTLQF